LCSGASFALERGGGDGAEAVWANTRAAIPALREINLRATRFHAERAGLNFNVAKLPPPLRRCWLVHQTSRNKGVEDVNPRNIERFPERFMFRLVEPEMRELVTDCDHLKSLRFSHVPVYVFTEQGVAMLAAALKSDIAIKTSIDIMDAFVAMRSFLMSSVGVLQRLGAIELKQLETDKRIDTVFDALDRGNLLPSGILPAASRPIRPATRRRSPGCWLCCLERCRRRESQTLVK